MSLQQQQDEDTAVMLSLSVTALDEAMNMILSNNFDVDSRVCIITLMKLLDNVLHKPYDQKVRSIRLENQAFTDKVGRRRGGIEFLQACGFTLQKPSSSIFSSTSTSSMERLLILHTVNEKTSHLVTARRLLQTRAVQDLEMKLEDLPVLKTPLPPPVLASASTTAAATAAGPTNNNTFNVYAGHRYDVQSAAAGTNLGPDANYTSSTDIQLQSLQKQQRILQKKLQQPLATSKDRQWRAWDASASNNTVNPTILAATVATASAAFGTTTTTSGDSSLLASRLQKQQRDRQQLEEGGFTTAAMRQVEQLKKQKVYSHVQLTIQFADGCKLTGKFIPSETMEMVRQALMESCFLPQQQQQALDFDLYVTPPRRILQNKKTLEQEGLAPAAKIFCSFKNNPKASTTTATTIGGRLILRPELFVADVAVSSTDITPAFPIAKPIVGESKAAAASSDTTMQDGNGDSKPSAKPKKKVSREDALLNRMMGRK